MSASNQYSTTSIYLMHVIWVIIAFVVSWIYKIIHTINSSCTDSWYISRDMFFLALPIFWDIIMKSNASTQLAQSCYKSLNSWNDGKIITELFLVDSVPLLALSAFTYKLHFFSRLLIDIVRWSLNFSILTSLRLVLRRGLST